jgi:hypothetical protein
MGSGGTGTGGFGSFNGAAQTTPTATAASPSRGGTGTGGFGSFNSGASTSPSSSGGSGGHGFFGSLASDLGGAGHWLASKAGMAGSDIKSIPTGLVQAGKALDVPFVSTYELLTHGSKAATKADQQGQKRFDAFAKANAESLKLVAEHPLRDPFMTAMTFAPVASTVGRLGAGAAEASSALRAGEGLQTAGKALVKPSILSEPRLVGEPGREPVSLYASHNAARRLVQKGIDKAVNHALASDSAKGILGHEGPVANYARYRMGGTLAERARAGIRYHAALVANTRMAGRAVSQFAKTIKGDVANPELTAQAFLHALHDNQLPEHEAILHHIEALRGINPEQNGAWAQAFSDAAKLGVVHLEDGRVVVDMSHPLAEPLAKADGALEKLGSYTENQLVSRGLREPASLEDRKARVGQLVQRSRPLLGEEPQALRDARRSLAKAETRHEKNLQAEEAYKANSGAKTVDGYRVPQGPHLTLGGKDVSGEVAKTNSNPYNDRLVNSGTKLEEARARVQQLEDRYGFSSPERRAAIEKGIGVRDQVAQAAHEHFGEQAPQELAKVEAFARHYARTNDVTPHEFYANFLHDDEATSPEDLLHNVMGGVRESLAPGVAEIARRMYAPNGWDQVSEERFVSDMSKTANGEHVAPEVQRLYQMTHEYIPGRGYVPMTVWEDALKSHSPMASSTPPITGEAKSPINTHFATGEATTQGLRRTDVAESVTAHAQKLFRFFDTLDHRELAANHGSDTRLSSDDTLMRVDRRTEAGFKLPAKKVAPQLKELLGVLEDETKLPPPEEEGLDAAIAATMKDIVGHVFPGHFDPTHEVTLADGTKIRAGRLEEEAGRGTKAPAGYVWVPKQLARLKDLEATVTRGEAGRTGRFMDNTNGAITAATVFYKIGHIFTRTLTNEATNIIQGSARPDQIAASVRLAHSLSPDEMTQALSYAGTHYYEAAPGATGSTVVARGMSKGLHIPFTDIALRDKTGNAVMSPQWWAHRVDAPFRFNSIAFEARHAGYEGVDGFRRFLHDVQDYNTLDAEQKATVDGVLRRADREAIAYDRLNQTEKRFISRAIWFYPWVKGSTVFTANTFLEHPYKSAVLGNLGGRGNEERQKALGDMPSYEQGLTPLSGGVEPVVSDLNTFNPFSTAADLLQTPSHLGNIAGMANPVYGAVLNTAEGNNPYGVHTPTPLTDNLKGMLGSTPEYQIGNAAFDHGDQSHKLFPAGHGLDPLYKNWLGELLRALGGPATPRHVNPEAGHSLAQRERTGR